jgi:hypothetical protein
MYQEPTIANVAMASANTEYSYAVPADTRKLTIKLRDSGYDLKLAYTQGQSGTTYILIPAGSTKTIENIYIKGVTLYFQTDADTQVLEVEVWK